MKRLKYVGYSIVMQEVPDEISLAINISGCPYKCKGCHSKYLWDYNGNYLIDDIDTLLNKYDGLITCVCFMGGDQNPKELLECIKKSKGKNMKTCLYTGCDSLESINESIIVELDYIKIGRFIEEIGGLDNKNTNQKMFDLKNNKEIFFYIKEK